MVTERPLWMRPVCSDAARSAGIEFTMILHAVIGMDGKPVALHLPFGVNSQTQPANLPGTFLLFHPVLSTLENLTPSFSMALFHSFALFLTLAEISPVFTNTSEKQLGYAPHSQKIKTLAPIPPRPQHPPTPLSP